MERSVLGGAVRIRSLVDTPPAHSHAHHPPHFLFIFSPSSDKTRGLQSTMSDLGSDSETRVRTLGREGQAFRSDTQHAHAHTSLRAAKITDSTCPPCLSLFLFFSLSASPTACAPSLSAASPLRAVSCSLCCTSCRHSKEGGRRCFARMRGGALEMDPEVGTMIHTVQA